MLKRLFDIALSLCALAAFIVPMFFIAILIKATSQGPVLYWSKRVGRNNKIFLMPKFRSMQTNAPQVATHLMADAQSFLTPIGAFLRKSSLDELPQIFAVLRGDMSIVGPRPALFNQQDLITLRTSFAIESLRPGITGWAQINGRDELPIPVKVGYDRFYKENYSFILDMKIIFATFLKVIKADGITH